MLSDRTDRRDERRVHRFASGRLRGRLTTSAAMDVAALRRAQLQGARHGVEDGTRRVFCPILLEPHIPIDADPGALGDLLAPETGRPAATSPLGGGGLRTH